MPAPKTRSTRNVLVLTDVLSAALAGSIAAAPPGDGGEGLETRWERHRANAEMRWDGLEAMGLSLLVADPARRIPSLTTVRVPDGIDEAMSAAACATSTGSRSGPGSAR